MTGTGLATVVHDHLLEHPWVSADEIAGAIGRHPASVRYALHRLEIYGQAEYRSRPRRDRSRRVAAEWRAT